MPRVKRGTIHHKRRKHLIVYAKGFRWGRGSKFAYAKQAVMKAWTYNYRDRKNRKRTNRGLWQIHINAASRAAGLSYSQFMGKLKKANIIIDRKILSELTVAKPEIFQAIVAKVK
jgi:large subunit ribosomal protein L20